MTLKEISKSIDGLEVIEAAFADIEHLEHREIEVYLNPLRIHVHIPKDFIDIKKAVSNRYGGSFPLEHYAKIKVSENGEVIDIWAGDALFQIWFITPEGIDYDVVEVIKFFDVLYKDAA